MRKLEIAVSPWALAIERTFGGRNPTPQYETRRKDFVFQAFNDRDSLWIRASGPRGEQLALRAAYCPDGNLDIENTQETAEGAEFHLSGLIGDMTVCLQFPEPELPLLRMTTTLKPHTPLMFPFWPRDLIPLDSGGSPAGTGGTVFVRQIGPRSGLLYCKVERPHPYSIFYLQNLTALNEFARATETSLAGRVGGDWPEIGFALPAAKNKPLPADKYFVISDALVLLDPEAPTNEFDMARQFLDLLAKTYVHLPQPETKYVDWPRLSENTLKNLEDGSGCWTHAQGESYLNAYVSDYQTPPESMVQLAVLLPLTEYAEWLGREIPLIDKIRHNLATFYDEKIGSIGRWLPSKASELDGDEEHKEPRLMDSWYLHHPLINLSRLALAGDKEAEDLFLDGVKVAMKVAHKFKYKWPVFYNIDTLEVVKAETQEGEGGEHDVGGLYAHVMLQAWELTGEDKYLEEAKKGALSMKGTGFGLMYQANDTAFSAGATLRLWHETGDEQYLQLGYLCLANLCANLWLWECDYGYAKNYPTFFAVFPLKNAPYLAAYEEQEVFAAFHDYLARAKDDDLLPSLRLLLPEFLRMEVFRASYYCPPLLPKEMLALDVKVGELDPDLWIPLEDLQDGWKKSGQVGQEVYGSGKTFGILTRHYKRVGEESFMVFIDYPATPLKQRGEQCSLEIIGDERLSCRMRIIPTGEEELPNFTVTGSRGRKQQEYTGKQTPEGHIEYVLEAGQKITLTWQAKRMKDQTTRARTNGQKEKKSND